MAMNIPIILLSQPRNAPDVRDQPRVLVHEWRMYQVGVHIHLAGFLANRFTCRITTPEGAVNAPSRQVHTDSGRICELVGPPANDFQALAVINARLSQLFGTIDADVTMSYWDNMQAAVS